MGFVLERNVLGRVLEFLEFESIVGLYCTGDRHFLSLLYQDSPTYARLHSTSRFMCGRFPTAVQNWSSLRHLEIKTVSVLAEQPLVTQRAILSLPTTLRSLTLLTPEAEFILEEKDPLRLADLHRVFMQSFPNAQAHKHPKMINLESFFPYLEKLVINARGALKRVEALMVSCDLFVLPKSLHTLEWLGNELLDDEVLDYLPADLVNLTLDEGLLLSRYQNQPYDSKPYLPSQLQTLVWRHSFSSGALPPSIGVIDALPRSLRTLECPGIRRFDASLLSYFPPHITKLKLPFFNDPTKLTFLPPALTELELPHVTIDDWNHVGPLLPVALKSLFINFSPITLLSLVNWELLPSDLERLTVWGNGLLLNHTDKSVLPLSLKYLDLSLHDIGEGECNTLEGIWPPQITFLKIPGPSSTFDNPHLNQIPRNLYYLSMDSILAQDISLLPRRLLRLTLDCASSSSLLGLPPLLAELIVVVFDLLTDQFVNALPSTLQVLRIDYFSGTHSINLETCRWPRSLTSLHLAPPSLLFTDQAILNLPSSLIKLANHLDIAAESIELLPRDLQLLSCNQLLNISDDPIIWPPQLNSLCYASGILKPSHLAALPRSLTSLIMPKENPIDPDHFHLLPFGISSFIVHSSRPTVRQYHDWNGPYDLHTRELIRRPALVNQLPTAPVRSTRSSEASSSSSNASSSNSSGEHSSSGSKRACIIS